MEDKFIRATKMGLRIPSAKGPLTVEDLWSLPLKANSPMHRNVTSLDDIAKALHRNLKQTSVSFVDDQAAVNMEDQLAFDIVKFVIDTFKAEQQAVKQAAEVKAKQQHILALIKRKEDDQLNGLSIEELRALLPQ